MEKVDIQVVMYMGYLAEISDLITRTTDFSKFRWPSLEL